MSNIKLLLNKYYKQEGANLTAHQKINKAEKHTPKYNKKLKREQYRRNRHLILKQLLNEIPFTITETQEQQIRRWIDLFNDTWKEFHRQASNETIILALIFIQHKQANPKIRTYEYSITTKYDLTDRKFEVIQNNLIFQLMKHTPLTYTLSKKYDHEILNKKGY